jgi:cellobiose phosphorylase
MDFVHRFGWPDVRGRSRMDPRISSRDATLLLVPCVPKAWRDCAITFRHHSAGYKIAVENPQGVSRGVVRAELDGEPLWKR